MKCHKRNFTECHYTGSYVYGITSVNQPNCKKVSQRAVVYAASGNLQKSLIDLNQSIQLKPNYADAFYNRGKTRTGLQDGKGAVADFTGSLGLNPNLAEAYGNQGMLYFRGWKSGMEISKPLSELHSKQKTSSRNEATPEGYQ